MAKIIGFSENVAVTRPTFRISNLRELKPDMNPNNSYSMIHNGPTWGIGYQQEIRYFLDDGTVVDFVHDFNGQVRFLKDYIANNGDTQLPSPKFEIASEVEFMDI